MTRSLFEKYSWTSGAGVSRLSNKKRKVRAGAVRIPASPSNGLWSTHQHIPHLNARWSLMNMENLVVEVTTTYTYTSSNCHPLNLYQIRLRENVNIVFNLKVGWLCSNLLIKLHMRFFSQFNSWKYYLCLTQLYFLKM